MHAVETAAQNQALKELDAPQGAENPALGEGNAVNRAPITSRKATSWYDRTYDRVEAFVSRLSMRDNFWNSICSLIWLPLAFFSGIRMKELDKNSIVAQAILPFRRFNRNWYRAMAGGALLANSEIAAGTFIFGVCGADYTVVCKNLNYTFLRPCFGPAVYRITPREEMKPFLDTKREFNITIDMEISQQGFRGQKDRRVGRCEATFHVTPKVHHKQKADRRNRS
jgi:hypothetical protein